MVPDASKSSLGLEYFCSEGDALWTMADSDLVELAKRELVQMGLAKYEDVEDGCVFRVPKSYPVYDSAYREHLATVRRYMDSLENVQTVGRNGLHRYNNQDHAMLTGLLAVRNLVNGEHNDLWNVNAEQEYHEEVRGAEAEPKELEEIVQANLAEVFMKIDRFAFGLSLGAVSGLILFAATLWLVLKGGAVVGPNLSLLSQFLPGYRVSAVGSIVGLLYGLTGGFVLGWAMAFLRNAMVFFYTVLLRQRAERHSLRRILEYL
jgi:hypothetical protein